jgi:alkyldihydroxyacetonephosphate synthase
MSDLLQRLVGLVVGAQHVSTAPADLADYAPPGAPPPGDVVAWPASAHEIAQILDVARAHGAALVPARRGMRWRRAVARQHAATRPPATVLVDLGRMASVLQLDETSLVVHAQAGIPVRALETALGRRGLTLGYFPYETFTLPLGALLARRRPELAATHLGPVEGTCLGVSAVLADGHVVHSRVAPRHAAGPDLLQLLLGCEGALGIITAAVLRVQRIPESRSLAAHAFPTFAAGLEAAVECLRRGVRLTALRLYDAVDAARCLGDDVVAAARVPRDGALLVTCSAGAPALCAAEVAAVGEASAAAAGHDAGAAPAEHWWRRRSGVPKEQVAFTSESLVFPAPVALLDPLRAAVTAAVTPTRARPSTSVSRLHLGGGCLVVTLAGERRARERARDRVRQAVAAVAPRPGDPLGAATAALKAALDPQGVLNPGVLDPGVPAVPSC